MLNLVFLEKLNTGWPHEFELRNDLFLPKESRTGNRIKLHPPYLCNIATENAVKNMDATP